MPIIGAHVSAAGGAHNCFANAEEIGAQALQIFVASPRQWRVKEPDPKEIEKFKTARKESGLGPVFAHASYLVNLASVDPKKRHGGATNLAAHLRLVEAYGIEGLIFHLGSAKDWTREEGIDSMAKMMNVVLDEVPGKSFLIMENSSGGGDKLGASPEEIGKMFKKAKNKRIKVCIDTAHAFAAGELTDFSKKDLDQFVGRCDKAFGWKNVVCIHLNDSKAAHGSFVDRHENIGEGEIGLQAFKHMKKHKAFKDLPWIAEVPGFDGNGSDIKNMEIVKGL